MLRLMCVRVVDVWYEWVLIERYVYGWWGIFGLVTR